MSKPMKPEAIQLEKVSIDKLKVKKYKNGQESKQARMTYDKQEFRIQTPIAKVPFGLNIGEELDGEGKPIKDSKKPKKYSFDIQVDGTPELELFKTVMQKLDAKNVDYVVSQSHEWWGESFTTSEISKLCYGSLLKQDKKKEYPLRFKVKLPFFDGKPQFKVYNDKNKEINWVTITKNGDKETVTLDWSWAQNYMFIETISECEGLWEVNKKVFCTFKAKQIRVTPPEELPDCAFEESKPKPAVSEPDSDQILVTPADAKSATDAKSADDDLKVADDDEDDEEEVEDDDEE